jgi:glutathione synthase/RimK-type ligase-like ATP-grasp enzyme
MYLIVTNKRDLTSDFIVLELQRRNLSYLRLNTEDITQSTFSYTPHDDKWLLFLSNTTIDLTQVKAAYFRRPGIPEPIENIQTSDVRQYCAMEWTALLQSLYWAIGERWLNSPQMISLAENKIRQLNLAWRLGFLVPQTTITNDPSTFSAFLKPQEMVGKPLKNSLVKDNSTDRVLFTTRLQNRLNIEQDEIRACPIIIQQEIKKEYDIRVTVVGNQIFAATIDSQKDHSTEVDWRRTSKPDLEHSIYKLPSELEQRCIALTAALGLRFGAIDLILDKNGKHWFLEINPNGQWGWIQIRTGLPIAEAIVSELEKISNE